MSFRVATLPALSRYAMTHPVQLGRTSVPSILLCQKCAQFHSGSKRKRLPEQQRSSSSTAKFCGPETIFPSFFTSLESETSGESEANASSKCFSSSSFDDPPMTTSQLYVSYANRSLSSSARRLSSSFTPSSKLCSSSTTSKLSSSCLQTCTVSSKFYSSSTTARLSSNYLPCKVSSGLYSSSTTSRLLSSCLQACKMSSKLYSSASSRSSSMRLSACTVSPRLYISSTTSKLSSSCLSSNYLPCKVSPRFYSSSASSSLFTSGSQGDAGYKSPVQVNLKLDARLSSAERIEMLRQNLAARGLLFDFDQFLSDYQEWKKLDDVKTKLETSRTTIAKEMAALVKDKEGGEKKAEKAKLIEEGKAVKEELREIMPSWWSLEEKVLLQALRLPTDLHDTVPQEEKVLEEFEGTVERTGEVPSHVETAEKLGLLKFSNVGPRAVYLLGELAEMEQSVLQYASGKVQGCGFTPIAGSEIFRTVVVEGCGLDSTDRNEILALHEREDATDLNAYHLKGNSLLSYAAFFAKMQLKGDSLPIKMCSVGRHYKTNTGESLPGLYGAPQSNRVTLFAACASGEETLAVHDKMVDSVWDVITALGLPARKTLVCVKKLAVSESLRTEFSIWAPSLRCFVEVGHVSVHNDFVSQRLMSRVRATDSSLLHMVSGVAVDTAVVLASLMEHSYSQGEKGLLKLPCLNN